MSDFEVVELPDRRNATGAVVPGHALRVSVHPTERGRTLLEFFPTADAARVDRYNTYRYLVLELDEEALVSLVQALVHYGTEANA